MPPTNKEETSTLLLPKMNSEKSDMKKQIRSLPNQPSDDINQKNWRFLRYSNARIRKIITAIAATLVAITWYLSRDFIPFKQQGLKVFPPTALNVFQVYAPISTNSTISQDGPQELANFEFGSKPSHCSVLLMEHSFGYSYGKPFVGEYFPPKCTFNKVTMNLTVTSKGRQFDRLAIMYFNDSEIWRTSTAEPTSDGIRWEYVKDLSAYMYFWKSPQKIIFDLGNLVNDVYTGAFNTTLTATFSMIDEGDDHASVILPISAGKASENQGSVFILPADHAVNEFRLPRNIRKAIVSLSTCGQAKEEFWWANTLQSDTYQFGDQTGELYGFSPFREVKLLIDGQLAGVEWPFPVVFTGGVVPGLWRPIVGIDAFDLRTHKIDISPWLSVLCDGEAHVFEIKVVGISDDGNGSTTVAEQVGSSWYVTGNIFLWTDEDENSITTGTPPKIHIPANNFKISSTTGKDAAGKIKMLEYTTNVTRSIFITSKITTQKGEHLALWRQDLSVTNIGRFTNYGLTQETTHKTIGKDEALLRIVGGNVSHYSSTYIYPLYANTSFSVEPSSGNFTLDATLVQGLDLHTAYLMMFSPSSVSSLLTTLEGSAHYFGSPQAKLSSGYGGTNQTFEFETTGEEKESYFRDVRAVNGTVVKDTGSLNGVEKIASLASCTQSSLLTNSQSSSLIVRNPRQVIGRGPGEAKEILVTGGGERKGEEKRA